MSDTIARLAAWRTRRSHLTSFAGPDRLSTRSDFGSNPGALRLRSYLPEGLTAGAPLVVVLHGCTQTAAEYDYRAGWSQFAEQAGFALLYPEQQRTNNPNLCFNWFLAHDARRGHGEALSIRQMIETFATAHDLDRTRVFITGLSAGGAMAAVMLAAYPEVFAGGAVIAGLPYGSASTVPEAFDRMRGQGGPSEQALQRLLREASGHPGPWPRISVWHGTADQTVVPANAEAVVAQWRDVHGLETVPDRSESTGSHTRRSWCNTAGDIVVELNTITSMGHGTPLGNDGLGTPGPYMLDVGISSTRKIADFWNIAGQHQPAADTAAAPSRSRMPGLPASVEQMPSAARRATPATTEATAPDPGPPPQHVSGVTRIIEDALRAAGLMKSRAPNG